MLEQLDTHMQKNELVSILYIIKKKNIKWAIDLNVRPQTTTLLKESMREKLCDLVLGKDFFDMKPKATIIQEQMNV